MSHRPSCVSTLQAIAYESLAGSACGVARVRLLSTLLAFLAVVPISTTGAQTAGGEGAIPTLDDIVIEGELVVPQVLFITARDPHRYDEYMYAVYVSSSLELARHAVMPMWLGLAPVPLAVGVADAPAEEGGKPKGAATDTNDADASRSNQ